jgi:protein SHQ1
VGPTDDEAGNTSHMCRADYADDEIIQDLIAWKHPFMDDNGEVQYTEEEMRIMLRLPRKEC